MTKEKLKKRLDELVEMYEIDWSDKIEIKSKIEAGEIKTTNDIYAYITENQIGDFNSETMKNVRSKAYAIIIFLVAVVLYFIFR